MSVDALVSLKSRYLNPRPFEMHDGGAIYQRLGVRVYKKYVPTSGDLITRVRRIKRLKIMTLGRRAALERHRVQTGVWEWRHLISALLLQSWAIVGGLTFSAEQFWVSTVINVVVNVYPIMVQRFTRVRINLCLARMQQDVR